MTKGKVKNRYEYEANGRLIRSYCVYVANESEMERDRAIRPYWERQGVDPVKADNGELDE